MKGVCSYNLGLYTYETFNHGDENTGSVTRVIVPYVSSHSQKTRICGLYTKMSKVYAVLTYIFFFSNEKLGTIRNNTQKPDTGLCKHISMTHSAFF